MLWNKKLEGHELWMELLGYSLAFMRPLGIISSAKIKRTNVEWKSIWNTLLFWDISYSSGWPWTPCWLRVLILWLLQCLFNYCLEASFLTRCGWFSHYSHRSLRWSPSWTVADEVYSSWYLFSIGLLHGPYVTFDLNLDIFRCFTQVLDCTKALFCLSQAGKATRLLSSLCIQKGEKPMLPVSRDMLRSQGWWVRFVSV